MAGRSRIVPMIAVALFLIGIGAAIPNMGNAADHMRVVTGIVEGVSGNSISFHGKSYDLKGIPAVHPSGRRLAVSDIARGMKVDLYFRNKKINSVVVYDLMVE